MYKAARTILEQADRILVKPLDIRILAETIQDLLAHSWSPAPPVETVATIIELYFEQTLCAWYGRVEQDQQLMTISLSREARTEVIGQVLCGLVRRLRSSRGLRSNQPWTDSETTSAAEYHHGELRRTQGYSAAMMANESRFLQLSVFETLNTTLDHFDFSLLVESVMAITDEISSELAQALKSYRSQFVFDQLPGTALLT